MKVQTFVTGPLATNTYIVSLGSEAIVIDPGVGSWRVLSEHVGEAGLDIVAVINTHGHWDHSAGDAEIIRNSGAALCIHEADADMVRHPDSSVLSPVEIEPAEPSVLVTGGDTLAFGGIKFKVLHTPGHTPGSMCLVVDAQDMIFTGDTLFQGTYGRYDLPGGDEHALMASLRSLNTLPPEYAVYAGHGPATSMGEEQRWLSML